MTKLSSSVGVALHNVGLPTCLPRAQHGCLTAQRRHARVDLTVIIDSDVNLLNYLFYRRFAFKSSIFILCRGYM